MQSAKILFSPSTHGRLILHRFRLFGWLQLLKGVGKKCFSTACRGSRRVGRDAWVPMLALRCNEFCDFKALGNAWAPTVTHRSCGSKENCTLSERRFADAASVQAWWIDRRHHDIHRHQTTMNEFILVNHYLASSRAETSPGTEQSIAEWMSQGNDSWYKNWETLLKMIRRLPIILRLSLLNDGVLWWLAVRVVCKDAMHVIRSVWSQRVEGYLAQLAWSPSQFFLLASNVGFVRTKIVRRERLTAWRGSKLRRTRWVAARHSCHKTYGIRIRNVRMWWVSNAIRICPIVMVQRHGVGRSQ